MSKFILVIPDYNSLKPIKESPYWEDGSEMPCRLNDDLRREGLEQWTSNFPKTKVLYSIKDCYNA